MKALSSFIVLSGNSIFDFHMKQKTLGNQGFLQLLAGIGPATSALPMRRTTDCAIAASDVFTNE